MTALPSGTEWLFEAAHCASALARSCHPLPPVAGRLTPNQCEEDAHEYSHSRGSIPIKPPKPVSDLRCAGRPNGEVIPRAARRPLARMLIPVLVVGCLVGTAPVEASAGKQPRPGMGSDSSSLDGRESSGTPERVQPFVFSTSEGRFDPRVENQGWWSIGEPASDGLDNYAVGWTNDCTTQPCNGTRVRNFFTFDLSRLRVPVEAATVVLRRYRSRGEPTEVLGLFDVTTPARVVNDNQGNNPVIYQDLGTGVRYGRYELSTNRRPASLVRLPLNRAAVTAINAARGHYFTIGGRLLSQDQTGEWLFGYSNSVGVQALIVRPREPQ